MICEVVFLKILGTQNALTAPMEQKILTFLDKYNSDAT